MPIIVICSECESRLNVQDDLLGRQMRCPICREVFTVATADAAAPVETPIVEQVGPLNDKPVVSRADAPPPTYLSGSVTDFLQVLSTEPEAPAAPKEIIWSEAVAPPSNDAPKEIIWSEHAEPALSAAESETIVESDAAALADTQAPEPLLRPRKKRSRLATLLVLVALLFGGLGAGGFYLKRYLDAAPDRLFAHAKKEYDAKNYEPARKLYDEFAKDHPEDARTPEARFFSELCALKLTIYSVAVRADPTAAERQLGKFLSAVEDPSLKPFIGPNKFAVDIWESALKLAEEVVAKGNDSFHLDKPDDSTAWLDRAIAVGEVVDRFRSKELGRESVYTQMDALRQKIAGGRARLDFLADMRQRLAEPDDTILLAAKKEADELGYAADASFWQLVDEADRKIADRVTYTRLADPVAPVREKSVARTGLLFAPRLDRIPQRPVPVSGPTTVFFALARGILYALDESDGHVLWAARTGIDSNVLPLLIPGSDLHPELAILVANHGTQSSLTACLARTGETYWHQPLPAAPIGQPISVGQRLYVPIQDQTGGAGKGIRHELGVILEYEVASGFQIGRLVIGRSFGAPGMRRPGTGQLFFPAESRGVYVFNVDRIGPDGTRLDPTYLGLLPTMHAPGSLRGEPIITPGDGDSAGYLVIGLADRLDGMKLRAWPLSAADKPPALTAEFPPIDLNGWLSFRPYCDSEKIALVTDRGEFDLFGIRQSGNLDTPIFVMPPEPFLPADAKKTARGQVVYADEGSFWFIACGVLHHLRLGLDFEKGLKLVRHGKPRPLGEPLHAAQINARHDLAMVVTQSAAGASCRATAINLQSGEIRWQRQIGLIAQGDPIRIGNNLLLMDQSAGLYQIDANSLDKAGSIEWLIDERWLVAPPLADAGGPGWFIPASDGKSVYAVGTTLGEKGSQVFVRHYTPDIGVTDRVSPLPAAIAGNPVICRNMAILPLANGLLYRLALDQSKPLEAGPTWRGERVSSRAVAHMTAIGDDAFVVSDGSKGLQRWSWPSKQDEFTRQGGIALSDKIAAKPLLVNGNGVTQVVLSDIQGNVTFWDAERLTPTAQPLQAFRPGAQAAIPAGPLSLGPFSISDREIAYAIDGVNLIRLGLTADGKAWQLLGSERLEGTGIVGRPISFGSRLLVTERGGIFQTFDRDSGKALGEPVKLTGAFAPAAAAVPIDDTMFLAPLSDGTLLLVKIK